MKSNRPIHLDFNGHLKIHKANIPIGPIVSLPGTPTYKELTKKRGYLTGRIFYQPTTIVPPENKETKIEYEILD